MNAGLVVVEQCERLLVAVKPFAETRFLIVFLAQFSELSNPQVAVSHVAEKIP